MRLSGRSEEGDKYCQRFTLQALALVAITLQGLQVTSLNFKMVAAKLTPSQHCMTNVKSGTSLLSRVHLTRSSRKSGRCGVTAVQKTFSLTPAEVRRIEEADAAKEAERHADHYFNVSIGSYNTIYLAAIFNGDKEEIESIGNAAVELGFGKRVDCCTIFYNNLAQIEQNQSTKTDLHNNRFVSNYGRIRKSPTYRRLPSTSGSMIRSLRMFTDGGGGEETAHVRDRGFEKLNCFAKVLASETGARYSGLGKMLDFEPRDEAKPTDPLQTRRGLHSKATS
ncbi:hypothetical protein K438DRAFT_1775788 [Mycena galopus ATCC 62051]|nr:hypothetical protein K438DRAFT_1775788 [Mycena galopus ATCC 62051]